MNVFTRGVKNALRSPIRSGAIILLLAVSIGLILSMLVARGSVSDKIAQVKSTTATSITINPAGVQGFSGGGNPLTSANVTTIEKTAHITSTVETLSDQLASTDTNLVSSLNLGSFGARQARFDTNSSGSSSGGFGGGSSTSGTTPTFTPRITVTGTSDPASSITSAGKITSGTTIDGSSSSDVALVGASLATKNNLKVGSTFTAYGQSFTVTGIYTTGTTFGDSNLIMPLATVQNLTSQVGDVSNVVATADSSDNVSSVVAALKKSLGSAADITSDQQEATATIAPLQSIESLATTGVIAASIAGGVIVLLAMIMIVRERRKEIGVIKAIGGTNGKVITQFMIEGLTLTFFGAIVGLGLGILVSGPMTNSLVASGTSSTTTPTTTTQTAGSGPSGGTGFRTFGQGFSRAAGAGIGQIRTNLTQVTASLTPQIFATAIGIIVAIALVGTAIPAWFIARVRPAEVLRTGE